MKKSNLICMILISAFMLWSCESFRSENPVVEEIGEENLSILSLEKSESHTKFGAFLSGFEEVPPRVAAGSGAAFFELVEDGEALKFQIRVANTTGITMGHIHIAPLGANGPIIVDLIPLQSPSPLQNGIIAEGIIRVNNFRPTWAGEPFSTLLEYIENGEAYVNIHTVEFPPGELRGQISGIKLPETRSFSTKLTGVEEVPPVDTKAEGKAKFKFNSSLTALDFEIEVCHIENIRFSHIHLGKKGTNGPVVTFLRGDKAVGQVEGLYAKGRLCDEDLIGLMLGGDLHILREAFRTGNAYVNLHTDKHPPGEIRGQL
jgi:hypothetical protein